MPTTIYHIETPYGTHGYYTSRLAMYLDNAEDGFPVGIDTLNRHDWSKPFVREGWTVRKGIAHTVSEVKAYHDGLNQLGPEDFE